MKLELLSKYRTHIMGAAMMWVMYFHTPAYGVNDAFGQFIHVIGFYGVDMFLMISGMGMYFSMRRSKGALDFYRRRAVRILPAYLIITVCWYLFYKTEVGAGDAVLAILGVNYYRGTLFGRPPYFDWFIPTLLVFYLLTPLYDRLFQKAQVKWKLTLLASVISPVLCIIGYHTDRQVLYGTFTRIPIFLIGYCIGWFLYEKKEEQKGSWMVHIALLTAGMILGYYIQTRLNTYSTVMWGLNTYPAILVAPSLSVILAVLFRFAEQRLRIVGEILLMPFYVCGRYSLEIYLIHQRLLEMMCSEQLSALSTGIIGVTGYPLFYFFLGVVTVLLAAGLHELIAFVIRRCGKKGEKPTPDPDSV